MIYFICNVCRASLSAEDDQTGSLVRCPSCLTTLTVPLPQGAAVGAGAGATLPDMSPPTSPPRRQTTFSGGMGVGVGRRYGFNCAYCSSRLEATESMAAQEGLCPTCGNAITVPILDRYGRLIDPVTKQIIKPDPHPVHAYAAAGERAPQVIRQDDGSQVIRCPKCKRFSPITANNCKHCGVPFTIESTTPEAAGASNGFAVSSLVLGIIGIPFSCTILIPILAVIFGGIALVQISNQSSEVQAGRGLAIAGLICGFVGTVLAVAMFTR